MHSIFIMNGFGIWNASPRAGLVADLWQEVVLYFIIFYWVILTIAPVVWERGRRSVAGSAGIPACTTVCPCVCLSVHPSIQSLFCNLFVTSIQKPDWCHILQPNYVFFKCTHTCILRASLVNLCSVKQTTPVTVVTKNRK